MGGKGLNSFENVVERKTKFFYLEPSEMSFPKSVPFNVPTSLVKILRVERRLTICLNRKPMKFLDEEEEEEEDPPPPLPPRISINISIINDIY